LSEEWILYKQFLDFSVFLTHSKKMETNVLVLKKKEKDLTNRLFRITNNFRKIEERREKNINNLRSELKSKKQEISRLENRLSQQIESSSRILAGESLLTSKKSQMFARSMENQTEQLLGKIVEIEKKNDRKRIQQRHLFEDLIDQKKTYQEDLSLLFSVLLESRR